jgi:hypothetical protein
VRDCKGRGKTNTRKTDVLNMVVIYYFIYLTFSLGMENANLTIQVKLA